MWSMLLKTIEKWLKHILTNLDIVRFIMLILYMLIVFWITIISRTQMNETSFRGLFWELSTGSWKDILLNILLFIPIGLLIGKWQGFFIGFAFSVLIEGVQYYARLGVCELDDVLHNTIGCLWGIYMWKWGTKMLLIPWDNLPEFMKCVEVKEYYDILSRRKVSLVNKRLFDIVVAIFMLIVLSLPMILIAVMIKTDSKGPVFYRQERVTKYGMHFKIHKFRTMVVNADKIGAVVTVNGDNRITKIGAILRKYRLDEFPQLFDVLSGKMSFVGTRPEAVKYVKKYKPEYFATLLLPAGITSEASIRYKDEAKLLDAANDVDSIYLNDVLPGKMIYNLKSIRSFSFAKELLTLIRTVMSVLGKEYN